MPTGVALQDPREQLFTAAERILLRDAPQALTSRAVTTEAGCAKGVLHRHFADFDDFLAELVRDRVTRLEGPAVPPCSTQAGTGTVLDNLTSGIDRPVRPGRGGHRRPHHLPRRPAGPACGRRRPPAFRC